MSYIPDCGNWIWVLGVICCSGAVLYAFVWVDEDWKNCDREWLWSVWTVVVVIGCLGFQGRVQNATHLEKVCWMGMAVYLIVGTVMDCILCQVNDVLQYLGVLGGCVFLWCREAQPTIGLSLLLFVLIQHFLFRKLYGGADTMAFLICSLFLAGLGGETEQYLWHMTLSYIFMGVVQVFSGNITKQGRLREPVPMVPYIAFGFLLLIQG